MVQRFNADGTPDESLGPGGGRLLAGMPNLLPRDAWLRAPGSLDGTLLANRISPNVVYYAIHHSQNYGQSNFIGSLELIQVKFDDNWKVISTKKLLRTKPGPGIYDPVLAWQRDGQLLVILDGKMSRLRADGTLDTAFGVKPFAAAPSYGNVISVQPDGKILVVRDVLRDWSGVQRLNADGSPDRTFAGGQMAFGFAFGIQFGNDPLVLADDSLIFGSTFDNFGFGDTGMLQLIKLRPNGGTPNTFDLKAHGITPFVIPQKVNTGFDSYATGDPAVNFGLSPGYGFNPFAPGGHALFSGIPLTSIWNPTDKRNLFAT